MIDKYTNKLDEKGVSPVIGVILLVAVTVALVALATVIVFDIGSGVSDTADASVQMEQTDSGVKANIVRNENVEEFILRHEDGTEQRSTKSIGSFTYDNGDGEYTLIGVVGGNEEVIRSTTVVGAEQSGFSAGDRTINADTDENIAVNGDVTINSQLDGDITAGGEVTVNSAGRVNGNIQAGGRVIINSGGRVTGNIESGEQVNNRGGTVDGSIDRNINGYSPCSN